MLLVLLSRFHFDGSILLVFVLQCETRLSTYALYGMSSTWKRTVEALQCMKGVEIFLGGLGIKQDTM